MECIELDVSELEAPEPLVLAMDELERLPQQSYLHLIHRMKPCRLYDYLANNNFYVQTRQGESGLCELFICLDSADVVKSNIDQLVKNMQQWPAE
ncbi:MAG: DUF2249 domain-containing protein [Gammaproteobacteria bacterium]|nr:DUF2249 domain-containing protein [Gammaproteobacteria bacterium]